MSVQPVATPRPSIDVSKNSDAPQARRRRKRQSEAAFDIEDDDWVPIQPSVTPTRAISEFFENDYDVM